MLNVCFYHSRICTQIVFMSKCVIEIAHYPTIVSNVNKNYSQLVHIDRLLDVKMTSHSFEIQQYSTEKCFAAVMQKWRQVDMRFSGCLCGSAGVQPEVKSC